MDLTKIKCNKCGNDIEIDIDGILKMRVEEEVKSIRENDDKKIRDEVKRELNKEASDFIKKREADFLLQEEKMKIELEKDRLKMAEELKNLNKKNNLEEELEKKRKEEEFLKEKEILELALKKERERSERSEKIELELRKERELMESERRVFEIEKQRKMDEERGKIRAEAEKSTQDIYEKKLREKEEALNSVNRQLIEAQRKANQGSQQTQGEVLELQLEDFLKQNFPYDVIEAVPKGVNGADIIERVFSNSMKECGSIVWEIKSTKNFTEGWVQKLKEDMRSVNGEIAVLVTEAMPKDIVNFGYRDGIWICNKESVMGIASALRIQIIEVALAKASLVGKNEKLEILYKYLSGTEFKHKVETMVENFKMMKEDLDKEKRMMNKMWASREKQIEQVVISTATMHGDLQGLLGGGVLGGIKLLDMDEEEDEKLDN